MKESGNVMKRKRIWYIFSCFLIFTMAFMLSTGHVAAAKKVKYNGKVIAKYNKSGQMVLVTSKNADVNYHNISYLVSGNKKKTIVIPKGSKIKINGVIRPGNNTTIIATGATITLKPKSNAVFCAPDKKVKNLTIIGGKWRSPHKGGWTGSIFAFAFAKNVVLDGVDCNANYKGHAIEIIACENVTVKNSKVSAIGKNPANCLEEQIQIDIATKTTAPKIAEFGSKYVRGQTCKNIYILNNTVKGARAVGVNWTNSEKGKWRNKYHENIVIEGNTLTGTTSEALAMFNVIGGEVRNNIITTNATRKQGNSSYTIGLHLGLQGKAPASMAGSKITIADNVIRGNRNGIHIKGYFNSSETKCLSRFGTIEVTGNTIYCKKGAENAIKQVRKSCENLIESDNQLYKW